MDAACRYGPNLPAARLDSVQTGPMDLQLTKDSIDLGIVVRDIDAALAFYRDVLGFEPAGDGRDAGRRPHAPADVRDLA